MSITTHVDDKDDWIMVVGGELPEVGTILQHQGEQIQVIGHGVRVTRAFGGTNRQCHPRRFSGGPVVWDVIARPQKAT